MSSRSARQKDVAGKGALFPVFWSFPIRLLTSCVLDSSTHIPHSPSRTTPRSLPADLFLSSLARASRGALKPFPNQDKPQLLTIDANATKTFVTHPITYRINFCESYLCTNSNLGWVTFAAIVLWFGSIPRPRFISFPPFILWSW